MWAKKAHELRTCTSNNFWEKSDQTRIKRTWHITYIKWNNWSPSNCYIPMHRAERKWTKIKITADCKIICVHGTNAIKFMWDTKITSTCFITLFSLTRNYIFHQCQIVQLLCTFWYAHFCTELILKYYIHHLLSHYPRDEHHLVVHYHLKIIQSLNQSVEVKVQCSVDN